MILSPCLHCHEEHPPIQTGWPCSWNDDRRAEFYSRLQRLGVIDSYIPGMAGEIERLLLVSPYRVNELELYRYLESSNRVHRRYLDLLDQELQWQNHCKQSLNRLCPTEKHSCLIGIGMIFGYLFAYALVFVLTIPVRLSFKTKIWFVKRSIHPLFTGWLAKHGVRK